METGSWGRLDAQQGGSWRTGARQLLADKTVPHLCADKEGGTSGQQDRLQSRVIAQEKKALNL